MRIEIIDSQLDYYSEKYIFHERKDQAYGVSPVIESEVLSCWKKLFQRRTIGVNDISESGYEKIVESVQYYSTRTGMYSTEYIPDGIFYSLIDPFLNHEDFANQFDNKSYYPLLFHDILQPNTIALRLGGIWFTHEYEYLSIDDVYKKCQNYPEIVLKYSRDSCGGSGVFFYSNFSNDDLVNAINLSAADMIIQEPIVQHECLARLHKKSVNSIRLVTLLSGNETFLLSSVLRMGNGDKRIDNASAGGIVCGINADGTLKNVAYDKHGNTYLFHPQGGQFNGVIVPGFTEVKNLALKLQYRFPNCRMLSWDFTIDSMCKPLLIEVNMRRGELDFHQFCNGPLFGKLFNEVIGEAIERYL